MPNKPKKERQWKIDRAFKIVDENEARLRNILQSIQPVKYRARTEEQAIKEMERLGVLALRDEENNRGKKGFEQSTATLPRSYGLICKNAYETSEIADLYLNNELSFKDMFTLQILKKEFIYDEAGKSEVLRPVIVTLKVLLEIREICEDLAWIDAYDYFCYLTEIKAMSEVKAVAQKIAECNRRSDRTHGYRINDFDMWEGVFITSGLLVSCGDGGSKSARYKLNDKEIEFIKWLVALQYSDLGSSNSRRGDEEQREIGMVKTSIISKIPKLEIDSGKEYDMPNFNFNGRAIMESYLFDGKSFREIEVEYFGEGVADHTRGYLATAIVDSYGIEESAAAKGVFSPFKTRKELVKLSMKGYENTKLYNALFGGDQTMLGSIDFFNKAKPGLNRIYYGAPGCGKSHYVKKMLSDAGVSEDNVIRVTFHPEYSNYDFVGQILPTVKKDEAGDDIVTYTFNPGPFTLALEKALLTDKMVYLVIEEINRGNAAAIFGDLFQLLDREKNLAKNNCGWSEYPISNPNIEKYLKEKMAEAGYDLGESFKTSIPCNLTIYATMNSSDQNVYTLDTAFKRRWYFEQISNDITKDSAHEYKHWYIPGTDVTWEEFLVKINDRILDPNVQIQMNEDKRLGKYFVTKSCLTETVQDIKEVIAEANEFAYKVLEYIWNDVCKAGKDNWFEQSKYRTLEDVISAFVEPKLGESPLAVFRNIDTWK